MTKFSFFFIREIEVYVLDRGKLVHDFKSPSWPQTNLQLTMIYSQKTLAGKPQLILEGEQESDVHALSIRTAGG